MTSTLEKPIALGPAVTAAPPRGRRRPSRRFVTSWLGVALLLAVWQAAPNLGWVDRTFLPPLSQVLHAWWDLAKSGELWADIKVSMQRSLTGFGIAIGVGVPLGLLIGWYPLAAELLNPVLTIFLNTAAIALLPVFTLILGIGETSKISIIVYASIWPVLYNTIGGVRGVDPLLIKSARSLGVGQLRLFQKVILPAAVPTIFTGVRLAGAASILVLITTEMVGAKAGLGYLIINAQFNFQIPQMYAGIITVSAAGVIFNALLMALERRFSTWLPARTNGKD
ncbi:MAG: NitT/TauT family transport system permease protein [Pseudonocardiales bacterium]|nr:NitT/TauT family transport system permease protein [Pseudonocardiales bacterium]